MGERTAQASRQRRAQTIFPHIPVALRSDATYPKEDSACVICLSPPFPEADDLEHEPVVMPCGHIAGRSCLAGWLAENPSCPICRKQLNYK